MASEVTHNAKLLADIEARIQAAQTRSVLAVHAELIRLCWGIGRLLDERQAAEGCRGDRSSDTFGGRRSV